MDIIAKIGAAAITDYAVIPSWTQLEKSIEEIDVWIILTKGSRQFTCSQMVYTDSSLLTNLFKTTQTVYWW